MNLPFGDGQTCTGTDSSRLHFTGDERDAETGLDHTLFRQYQSLEARWLSVDPLGGDFSEPQSLNRYAYVENDPASFVDPSGLYSCLFYAKVINNNDEISTEGYFCRGFLARGNLDEKRIIKVNKCAAEFADKNSLANKLNVKNSVLSGILSNDAATVSDLMTGRTRGNAGSLPFSNPTDLNGVALTLKGIGAVPNPLGKPVVTGAYAGIVVVTTNSSRLSIVFQGVTTRLPTLAESAFGKLAGKALGILTALKVPYDAGSYLIGLTKCAAE